MRSIRYYIVSLLLVTVFMTGTLLYAAAEGEENSVEDSFVTVSSELPSADAPASSLPESSLEESVPDDRSDVSNVENSSFTESSEEPSFTESSVPESSEEPSFAESSVPESSAEISAESSVPESSEESSFAESSVPESSAESFVESSVTESSAESVPESREPSETSSRGEISVPEESSRPQTSSHTGTEPEEPSENSRVMVNPVYPQHEPLRFLAGLSTVIPAQRERQPSETSEYSTVASWTDDSNEEISYRPIGDVPLMPINEPTPDVAAVQPTRSHNIRPFLVGLIIFALLGMGLTTAAIVLLRLRGEFTPSFLRFDHHHKTKQGKGKHYAR